MIFKVKAERHIFLIQKILQTLILLIMMYRVYQKKSRKVKKKSMCIQQTTTKLHCYHFLPYISVHQNELNKANERNIKLNQYRY